MPHVGVKTLVQLYWTIKENLKQEGGSLHCTPGMQRLHVFPTFQVGFRIMDVGLQWIKLDLKTVPYPFYKDIRALTRAGEFEVRSFFQIYQ